MRSNRDEQIRQPEGLATRAFSLLGLVERSLSTSSWVF
jgi:hypothetical protein